MGFVAAPDNPQFVLEVWKLPTGQHVHLWPSDMLNDAQRGDQMAIVMSALRSD